MPCSASMLVPRFWLQNLMRLGNDVSRFAYQSPPPLYFNNAILQAGCEKEFNAKHTMISMPPIFEYGNLNGDLFIQQRYNGTGHHTCSFCSQPGSSQIHRYEVVLHS